MHIRKEDKETYRKMIESRSVKDMNGCWIWSGSKNTAGYGVILLRKVKKTACKVHRLAYTVFKRNPRKYIVRHTCDNPGCVNPGHLIKGSHADNARDRALRGRGGKVGPKPLEINVRVLRMLYGMGYTQKRLSHMFGVCTSTIRSRLTK